MAYIGDEKNQLDDRIGLDLIARSVHVSVRAVVIMVMAVMVLQVTRHVARLLIGWQSIAR